MRRLLALSLAMALAGPAAAQSPWPGVAPWLSNPGSTATGNVTGPGSSTTGNIATYGDTTGKVLQDSGIAATNVLVNGGALGTPSSATLTNATGLPISTGVSGLGTGVATFLGTPSGANFTSMLSSPMGPGSIGGSAASHAVPVDVAGTTTWKVIGDCQDSGGNHLNYTQSTDAFSCGTTAGPTSDTVTTGISAAGTTQGTATALTTVQNVISTCAAGAGVVMQTGSVGGHIDVMNEGANPCIVYPVSGGTINALAANAGLTIGADTSVHFDTPTTTHYRSIP